MIYYNFYIQLTARDKVLIEQNEAGGVEKWKKSSGYHQRSKVETFFSRYKNAFGESSFFQKPEKRKIEIKLKIALLNKFAYQNIQDTA